MVDGKGNVQMGDFKSYFEDHHQKNQTKLPSEPPGLIRLIIRISRMVRSAISYVGDRWLTVDPYKKIRKSK